MKLIQTVLFYILISRNVCDGFTSKDAVTSTFLPSHDDSTLCTNDKCIMKCCPLGKHLSTIAYKKRNDTRWKTKVICEDYHETSDVPKLDVIETGNVFATKPNLSGFNIKAGIYMTNKTFRKSSMDITDGEVFNYKLYLTERAELLIEMPNEYNRWKRMPNYMYCLDFINNQNESNVNLKPGVWTVYQNIQDETSRTSTTLMIAGMLVSCLFLLAVLVVYVLLQERNLHRLVIIAYVASLFTAFLFLAVMRIEEYYTYNVCFGLTIIIYFFFLASFCWMNVMSYDIWMKFRDYNRTRSRSSERFKYKMYCLYAWGLPLIMTIALGVLNNVDMSNTPWFVTPKISSKTCFIEGAEKCLYLYIPMLILISCNWAFYISTAYKVWLLSRGTSVLDSEAAGSPHSHRSNYRRFMVYLKLSIVMGLNWLLEVLSYNFPYSIVWVVTDVYNILIGISIFFIFIWKPNILKKVRKIFSTCKKSQEHCPSECSFTQVTQTELVCTKPTRTTAAMS